MIAKALHLNSLGGRINISEQLTSHCTDKVGPTNITQQAAGQSQYVRLRVIWSTVITYILTTSLILFLYMWSYQVVVVCLLVMTRRL